MKTLRGLLAWITRDFGPLLVFYGTNHFIGFVPAIIASTLVAVLEVAILRMKKQKLSAFLKFSIAITVLFGIVDVFAKGPLLFRYEAAVSNVITGVFFGMTLLTDKSIIQEFAERRGQLTGKPVPINPDTIFYFRMMSGVWTAYFFAKAIFYVWLGWKLDLERALAIRMIVGNVTFYALLFTSIFLAKPIILWMQRARIAPSTRATPEAKETP